MSHDTLTPVPSWVEYACQGLAYWLAYRSALYPHYHVSEGGIVDELCGLIQAHKPTGLHVEREFERFRLDGSEPPPRGRRPAVDICIGRLPSESPRRSRSAFQPDLAIEVKSWAGSRKECLKDVENLARHMAGQQKLRGFLVVASQHKRPTEFVSAGGTAVRQPVLPAGGTHARVRRVVKCLSSARSSRGQWVCLLEVLSNKAPSQVAQE